MTKITVEYFVQRTELGEQTATAELTKTLNISNSDFEELKTAAYAPEKNRAFQKLQNIVRRTAERLGYEFISILTIGRC